jgi:hypothetical protein
VTVQIHAGDDAGWRKLLTRPSELSSSSASIDIWEQVGGMDEGVIIFLTSIEMRQQTFNMP